MKHTATTILTAAGLLILVASNGACGSDDGGVFPAECNGDGRCNGTFDGMVSGAADTPACADREVTLTITDRALQITEFEADCELGTCGACQSSFSRSATIDPDTCAFSISYLGQSSVMISGSLDQGSCTVSGTYTYGGPPGCPCWEQGSWGAAR